MPCIDVVYSPKHPRKQLQALGEKQRAAPSLFCYMYVTDSQLPQSFMTLIPLLFID